MSSELVIQRICPVSVQSQSLIRAHGPINPSFPLRVHKRLSTANSLFNDEMCFARKKEGFIGYLGRILDLSQVVIRYIIYGANLSRRMVLGW